MLKSSSSSSSASQSDPSDSESNSMTWSSSSSSQRVAPLSSSSSAYSNFYFFNNYSYLILTEFWAKKLRAYIMFWEFCEIESGIVWTWGDTKSEVKPSINFLTSKSYLRVYEWTKAFSITYLVACLDSKWHKVVLQSYHKATIKPCNNITCKSLVPAVWISYR